MLLFLFSVQGSPGCRLKLNEAKLQLNLTSCNNHVFNGSKRVALNPKVHDP